MSETDYWDLYVTNTQTLYPSQNPLSEILIRLYGRTRSGDTKTVTVKGFEPFFYTEEGAREEVPPASNEHLERYEDTDVLPLSDRFDDITPWREERDLVKVVADQPSNVPELRSHFDKTWAADTIFEERFRVESGIRTGVRAPASSGDDTLVEPDELEPVEIEDVNPRVLTLDIETDDRDSGFPSPGEARILSIAAHDSYEDELIVFVDRNGQSFSDFLGLDSEEGAALDEGELTLDDLGLDFDRLVDVDSEQDMLRTFSSFLSSLDPDLVCGWNSGDDSNDGFDLPHIIERMAGFGIGPGRLARDGSVEVSDYDEVTIGGRSTYDLMDGWEDTKFTNPTSKRLEYVANQALDDAKIPHPELGYYEMYEQETRKFLNYNAKDTELTVRINEQENVLGFKKRLKDMIGVDWERTHQNNEFIEMSIRRKLREHDLTMVTAYDNEWVQKELESGSDGVNYEGAYVFPSFAGLLANILGLDLASLYPMTQWMLNASPDTRIDREKAFKHDIPHVVAENGQCFRDDVDGIIRELVDEYRQVKKEFKQRRNNAEYGTAEWDEFAEAYNVTKTIYNCVTGDHEVMTVDGVVNIKDVEVGDEVYSLDPETGRVELKEVTETFAYPEYDGDLIEIDTTNINQTLTPNHRTIVRQRDGYVKEDQYKFVEAGDLNKSSGYEMPTPVGSNPEIHGPGMDTFSIADGEVIGGCEVRVHPEVHGQTFRAELPDDIEMSRHSKGGYVMEASEYLAHQQSIEEFCGDKTTEVHYDSQHKYIPMFYDGDAFVELLAWYTTEGSVYRDGSTVQVNIAQKEAGDRPAVADVLERCGLDYKEDEPQLWFTSHVLGDLLEDLCGRGSENKRLPDFVWNLSPDQKRLLFRTLIEGDGDKGQNRYSTQSEDLRDDFMRLAVEFGQNVRYHEEESWGGYRVRWNEANNHFRMNRSSERREADSEEGVYCITVEDNHTMLCGRDGSFSWTGQSFYGYSGWDKSPLYNPHDAAAVTLTSQRVIKRTAEYIDENTPAEVVYGDTDSNYVQFPEDWEQEETLEYAEELCETLSEEVYPKLCDEFLIPREKNRWLIEVEMRAERFFMSGSKKHYAYLKTWDEGDDFDDVINADGTNDDLDLPVEVPDTHGKFSVTGYAPVKSNFSPKTKETQGNVLEAAVRGADESDISEIIHEAAAGISVKDPDWMEVGMPQGLGQKLDAEESYRDDYYAFTNGTPQGAHPRGAWFANQLLDVDYGQDSKPRRVYLDPTLYVESAEGEQVPVDVVAFETEEDLEPIEDELKMDATAMQEKTLRNPLSDICDALGIDIDAAFTGQQQTGLESFL